MTDQKEHGTVIESFCIYHPMVAEKVTDLIPFFGRFSQAEAKQLTPLTLPLIQHWNQHFGKQILETQHLPLYSVTELLFRNICDLHGGVDFYTDIAALVNAVNLDCRRNWSVSCRNLVKAFVHSNHLVRYSLQTIAQSANASHGVHASPRFVAITSAASLLWQMVEPQGFMTSLPIPLLNHRLSVFIPICALATK